MPAPDPEMFVLVVQVRRGPFVRPRLLIVRRAPRVCVPWWRAVAAALALVLGLDTWPGEEEEIER
jgi:hypothetical protein